MSYIGFLFLSVAVALGLLAYLLTLYLFRSEGKQSLIDLLLIGNRQSHAAISIIGTIFSGSILFTGMIHFYRIYSFALLPCYIAAAALGFYLLSRKVHLVYQQHPAEPDGDSCDSSRRFPELVFSRFHQLTGDTGARGLLYLIFVIYLASSLITEISVFRASVATLSEESLGSICTLALVAITFSYVYVGGFRGVLLTDVIQTITIIIAFCFIFYEVIFTSTKPVRLFGMTPDPSVGTFDYVAMAISALLVGVAYVSATPEIWIRVASLRSAAEPIVAIRLAFWGILIVLMLPIILINQIGKESVQSSDLTDTFSAWEDLIGGESSVLIAVFFIVLLVTAIFTTLDTFILTFEQVLLLVCTEFDIAKEILLRNIRRASPILVACCFIAANRLDKYVLFLIGALCISIPLILLSLLYVAPPLRQRGYPLPGWVFWCPLVVSMFIMPITHELLVAGKPSYYLVTLGIAVSQLFFLVLGILVSILSRLNRKSETGRSIG